MSARHIVIARLSSPVTLAAAWALVCCACQFASDDSGSDDDAVDDRSSGGAGGAPVASSGSGGGGRAPSSNGAAGRSAAGGAAGESTAPPSTPPAATPPADAPAASGAAPPTASARTIAACTATDGDCDEIYVTITDASPPRCIQLDIDNCGTYDRPGLRADTPFSWRLASGTISGDVSNCEPGVFYPGSTVLAEATGSIDWNTDTQRPTELVLELTLEPPSSAADQSSIDVATSQPLNPEACAD